MATFGEMLRERRKELRLGLREFALRAGMDAGNLSKIERGRMSPPQSIDILDRICLALELDPSDDGAARLRASAATENGRIPEDIMSDAEVMAQLPILLRTLQNKQIDAEQLEKLIEMIRNA